MARKKKKIKKEVFITPDDPEMQEKLKERPFKKRVFNPEDPETQEKLRRIRETNAERTRRRRLQMTPEETKAERERAAQRAREKRANLSPEELARRRSRDAALKRIKRAQETEEQRAKRRSYEAEKARERRRNSETITGDIMQNVKIKQDIKKEVLTDFEEEHWKMPSDSFTFDQVIIKQENTDDLLYEGDPFSRDNKSTVFVSQTNNGQTIEVKNVVRRRMSGETRRVGGFWRCEHCGKMLSTNKNLIHHLVKLHGLAHEKKVYVCDLCGFVSPTRKQAVFHRRQVHRRPDGNYECQKCGKLYDRYINFIKHISSHEKNKYDSSYYNFICEICGKTLKTKDSLRSHMCLIHNADGGKYAKVVREKKFFCNLCDKGFAFRCLLRTHFDTAHMKLKPFLCSVCGKGYHDSSTLNKHFLIHTSERPFRCETCGRGFLKQSLLNNHQIVHTDEYPFICDICGKAFQLKESIFHHMKVHNIFKRYKCDTCGQSFHDKSYLTKHFMVHTGEYCFSCPICRRGFRHSSNYNSHMSKHHFNTENF